MGSNPPVDNGVQNLERFIGILITSTEQVQQANTRFETDADELSELAGEAQAKSDALDGALEEFHQALEAEHKDAEQDIQELGEAARDIGDKRFAEAEQELEQAGADLEAKLDEGERELERDHAALSAEGFDGLGTAVDQARSGLEQSRQDTETAFDELSSGLDGFQQRADAGLGEAGARIEQSTADVQEKQAGLATDASDGVQGFEAAATDFGSTMESLGGELSGAYDGWNGRIESDAQDLATSVETLMQDEAGFVESAQSDSVEEPVALTIAESVEPYSAELDRLAETLDGAQSTQAEIPPLVDELERCQGVIGTIDELLNAVE